MLNSSRGVIVTAFSILRSSCRLGPDAKSGSGDVVEKLIYQICKNPHPNIVVLTVGAAALKIAKKIRRPDAPNWRWRCQLEERRAVLEVVCGKQRVHLD
ncbi:hypothetical protein ABKV19_005619 [Rosa sericea]